MELTKEFEEQLSQMFSTLGFAHSEINKEVMRIAVKTEIYRQFEIKRLKENEEFTERLCDEMRRNRLMRDLKEDKPPLTC